MSNKIFFSSTILVSVLIGCTSSASRNDSTIAGAAIGATGGAVVGAESGHAVAGAAGGAVVGGVVGAAAGSSEEKFKTQVQLQEEQLARQHRRMQQQGKELQDVQRQEFWNQQLKRYENDDRE